MGPWLFWLAIICSVIGAMLFAADAWIFGRAPEYRGMSEEQAEVTEDPGSTPSRSTPTTPRTTQTVADTGSTASDLDGYQEGLGLFLDGLTYGAPPLPDQPAQGEQTPPATGGPIAQVTPQQAPAVTPTNATRNPRATQSTERQIREIADEVGVEVITFRALNRREVELELRAEGATSHAQIPEVVDLALRRGVIRDFDDRALDENTQVSVNPQSGARIFTSRFTVDLP